MLSIFTRAFFPLNFYLFIFGCVRAFSSCGEPGLLVIVLRGLLLLRSTGSRCAGFSSCGTQAQQLQLAGSRVQAQWLWRTGLVAPWHVGSSRTRNRTRVPCIGRQILIHCATREVPHVLFDNTIFFGEASVQTFCLLFPLGFMEFLILHINILSARWFANIFSHIVLYLFILWTVSFEAFVNDEIQAINFFLLSIVLFKFIFKKTLPNTMSQNFSPFFL